MNILVLMEDKDLREMIEFELQRDFDLKVIKTEAYTQAIDYILENDTIDLIVCGDSENNTKFFKFLVSSNYTTPIFLNAKGDETHIEAFPDLKFVGRCTAANFHEELIDYIERELISGRAEGNPINSDYARIKTELLIKVVPLTSDIFIKLSDKKFVRLFKKGETFGQEDVENYLGRRKIEYLYVPAAESVEFAKHFSQQITNLLRSGDVAEEDRPKLIQDVHEAIMDLSAKVGFPDEVQELVREHVDLTVQEVGKHPTLKKLFEAINRDKDRYISAHSSILAMISGQLADKMGYPSETTCRKLSLAAFFHDVGIPDQNQALAFIETQQELEEKKAYYSLEHFEGFMKHPNIGADVIRRFKEIPPDVDVIIAQHHERPDGTGFPRGLKGDYISPLAAVFIVSHDIVHHMMSEGDDFDMKTFLVENKAFYNKGTFKKAINSLEEIYAD